MLVAHLQRQPSQRLERVAYDRVETTGHLPLVADVQQLARVLRGDREQPRPQQEHQKCSLLDDVRARDQLALAQRVSNLRLLTPRDDLKLLLLDELKVGSSLLGFQLVSIDVPRGLDALVCLTSLTILGALESSALSSRHRQLWLMMGRSRRAARRQCDVSLRPRDRDVVGDRLTRAEEATSRSDDVDAVASHDVWRDVSLQEPVALLIKLEGVACRVTLPRV